MSRLDVEVSWECRSSEGYMKSDVCIGPRRAVTWVTGIERKYPIG